MILTKALENKYTTRPKEVQHISTGYLHTTRTKSGQTVTVESSKSVAAFYRAGNEIINDIAAMPFQKFNKGENGRERVLPDAGSRNLPYLLEVSPNNFGWTPFHFFRVSIQWLLYHGNAYAWRPPIREAQLFILPADSTRPVLDEKGAIWYETYFSSSGKPHYIPAHEVMHTLINPDRTGQIGRGIVTFARESLGRRMAANQASSELYERGMNATAYIQMNGQLDKDGRKKVSDAYTEALQDGLAVFDNKVAEFKTISLSMADTQFIEQNQSTDLEIANFFGIPPHFIGIGKESYQSNTQKYEEFLKSTLNSHLVQYEQAARIKWLPAKEQADHYFRFNRASLLRMDAKERAATNEILIRSGQLSPAEARAMEERNGGSEEFFMTKNYADIEKLGEANVE